MPAATRRATPQDEERVEAAQQEERRLVVIRETWDREANSIANLLTHEGDVARFRELTLDAIAKDPKLTLCTPISLIRAIRNMAKLNLEPVLGEAYLVPFWSTKESSYVATLIVGYEGLKTLAFNSGFVTLIESDVVRTNDEFVYVRGYPESVLRHVRAQGERGEIAGAWSMVWLRGAERPLMDYLPVERIEQARKVSKSGTNDDGSAKGIWQSWPEEMAAKTALRHCLKLAPKSVRARVAQALDLEDAVDSMLVLEGGGAPALPAGTRASTPRRRRMLARLTGTPEAETASEAPGATEPPDEDTDSGSAGPEAGQPSEAAQASESEAPVGAEEGEFRADDGKCGSPDPIEGQPCGLPAGHLDAPRAVRVHRQLDATGKVVATWPA